MTAIAYTIGSIITDAFIEIGACPPGENPSPEEQSWGLDKANDLIDIWQALQAYVYGYQFNVYTLVADLSPHTIGPAASTPPPTFSTGEQPRPVRLESAALLLDESSPTTVVDNWIRVRDRAWWAAQQVKAIETNVPTDVYYDPLFPLGALNFWPVPNVQRQVRLQLWQTVSQFDEITDPIGGPGGPGTLPPAYRTALKLSLAELLCPGANREPSPVLVSAAAKARAAVFGNNAKSPRIQTQDAGMPRSGSRPGTRGDFNWYTGGQAGGPPE